MERGGAASAAARTSTPRCRRCLLPPVLPVGGGGGRRAAGSSRGCNNGIALVTGICVFRSAGQAWLALGREHQFCQTTLGSGTASGKSIYVDRMALDAKSTSIDPIEASGQQRGPQHGWCSSTETWRRAFAFDATQPSPVTIALSKTAHDHVPGRANSERRLQPATSGSQVMEPCRSTLPPR